MTINVRRSGLEPEVSEIRVFRNLQPSLYKAENGRNYVYFSSPHSFKTGDLVTIENLDSRLNGTNITITADDDYTISWSNNFGTTSLTNGKSSLTLVRNVIARKRENNIATLQTSVAHKFITSDTVTVENIAVNFLATNAQITNIPISDKFSYSNTGADTLGTDADIADGVADGWIDTTGTPTPTAKIVREYTIQSVSMTNNVATLNTSASPFYESGQTILVTSNAGSPWAFFSFFVVDSVGSFNIKVPTSFSWTSAYSNSAVFGWTWAKGATVAVGGANYWSYPEYPQNSTVPQITDQYFSIGSFDIGTELFIYNPTGYWSSAKRYRADNFSYQWYRTTASSGGSLTAISGATGTSYTTTVNDEEKYVTCIVTATNTNPTGGTSVESSNRIFVLGGPLQAPTITSSPSYLSASVSWTAVTGAANYEYRFKLFTATTFPAWTQVADTVTSVNLTGLTHNSDYTVEVRANKSNGTKGNAGSHTFSTLDARPTVPRSFTASTDRAHEVRLTWTNPVSYGAKANGSPADANDVTYYVQRAENSNFSGTVTTDNHGTGVSVGKNPLPGNLFYWRVYASNSFGSGPATGALLGYKVNVDEIRVAVDRDGSDTNDPLYTLDTTFMNARLYLSNVLQPGINDTPINFEIVSGVARASLNATIDDDNEDQTMVSGVAQQRVYTDTSAGNFTVRSTFNNNSGGIYTVDKIFTVTIRAGRVPNLVFSSRNNAGFVVSHSNYSSSWSYSGTETSNPAVVFNTPSVESTSFTVEVKPLITNKPTATQTSTNLSCPSGTWTASPSATYKVTSTRAGYESANSSITNNPSTSRTLVYTYQWQYGKSADITFRSRNSSGVATITTATAHGFSVGQSVTVSGSIAANWAGTWTIASIPTSTTFTYATPTTGAVATTAVTGTPQARASVNAGPWTDFGAENPKPIGNVPKGRWVRCRITATVSGQTIYDDAFSANELFVPNV